MSTSTNTFLEFNRDLFLCNTIHDPQNLDGVVPVIKDGDLYKRKTVTDPQDTVYLLPPDSSLNITHVDYKKGYFQNDQVIYDITINPVEVVEDQTSEAKKINAMLKWWESESETSIVKKINYKNFANNINNYITKGKTFDIWLGSGRIDLSYNYFSGTNPQKITTQNTSIIIGNKIYTFGTNVDYNTVIMMLTKIRTIQNLEKDINYLDNFIRDEQLSFNSLLTEAQAAIDILKRELTAFLAANPSINHTIITDSQTKPRSGVGIISGLIDPTERYVFTVKRGHLVRYNPGFVGSCDGYDLKTICPKDNTQNQENCEICKNFQYRDWYDQNNPTQIDLNARYDDATSEYQHMWLQTWNLGIGIIILTYGIYYQLS